VLNPLACRRSEALRSVRITYLNALYKGLVDVNVPYYYSTAGQWSNGVLPNKSGEIPILSLFTNSVIYLGCSRTLLKNLTQLFYASTCRLGQLLNTYKKLLRVSMSAVRTAHRSILRRRISARLNITVPPTSDTFVGLKHEKITLPYSNELTANAFTSYTRTLLFYRPSNFYLLRTELKAA
jgi:hypothetical protein